MVNLRSQISWQSMLSWLLSPLRAKNKKNRAALLHILFWASEYTQIRFWKKNNSFWTSIWKTINACGDNCSSLRQPWRFPEAWCQPCCVIVVLKAFNFRGFRFSMLVERVAAAIRCVRHRKPQSTRYIHRFSSIFAILHRVWHRDPQLTRYVFRFSTVFAILWCKIISAEYFLSNVSRFCWPLFECIAFWREFSRFFPSFNLWAN